MVNPYRSYITAYGRHFLRDLQMRVSLSHHFEDLRRFLRRFRQSQPVSTPPHHVQLYRQLLEDLSEHPQCQFRTLLEHTLHVPLDPDKIHVVLRHDIDRGDPDVTMALCNVERELGLRSSVHILVDGMLYDPHVMIDAARKLREIGFDVGLHTQSWMQENYDSAFLNDLRRFEGLFGFSPATFSQHGAWPRTEKDMLRRREFTAATEKLIQGTSIIGYNNRRDWTSEDSNFRGQSAPIRQNFFQITDLCYLGGVAVILTHDNHWLPK